MKEKLEFDNPKTMDEVVQKAQIFYHQMKQKGEGNKYWTGKKGKKIFIANKNVKNVGTRYPGRKGPNGSDNMNQQIYRPQNEVKQSEASSKLESGQVPKPPLQCWGCGEPH